MMHRHTAILKSLAVLCLFIAVPFSRAQTSASAEASTVRAFAAARKAGAPALYAFLKPFPKGADLHMHLSGAIYAETFIAERHRSTISASTPSSSSS